MQLLTIVKVILSSANTEHDDTSHPASRHRDRTSTLAAEIMSFSILVPKAHDLQQHHVLSTSRFATKTTGSRFLAPSSKMAVSAEAVATAEPKGSFYTPGTLKQTSQSASKRLLRVRSLRVINLIDSVESATSETKQISHMIPASKVKAAGNLVFLTLDRASAMLIGFTPSMRSHDVLFCVQDSRRVSRCSVHGVDYADHAIIS